MTTKKTLYIKAYILDEEGRVMAQKRPGVAPVEHASIASVDTLAFTTASDQPEHALMVAASANIAALLLLSKRTAVHNTEATKRIVRWSDLMTDAMERGA